MEKDFDNTVLFYENMLGIKLTWYQKELLKNMNKKENLHLCIPRKNIDLTAFELMYTYLKQESNKI